MEGLLQVLGSASWDDGKAIMLRDFLSEGDITTSMDVERIIGHMKWDDGRNAALEIICSQVGDDIRRLDKKKLIGIVLKYYKWDDGKTDALKIINSCYNAESTMVGKRKTPEKNIRERREPKRREPERREPDEMKKTPEKNIRERREPDEMKKTTIVSGSNWLKDGTLLKWKGPPGFKVCDGIITCGPDTSIWINDIKIHLMEGNIYIIVKI